MTTEIRGSIRNMLSRKQISIRIIQNQSASLEEQPDAYGSEISSTPDRRSDTVWNKVGRSRTFALMK
jgi:hypothetical protein